MRRIFPGAIAAAVIGAAASLSAAPTSKAVAAKDWSRAIAATPEGGFRMGDPNAPVKLIEYGSLGCPTCARFAADGGAQLLALVQSGKVSFEFRNFVLSAPDLAASVLSRCGGAENYFRLNDAFLSSQEQWFARLKAVPQARLTELEKLPPEKQLAPLAALAGLDAIAAKAGIAPAKVKQCLTKSDAAIDRLVAMRRSAWAAYRVSGTPAFIVNGKQAEGAYTWSAIAPLLIPPGR